MAAQTRTGMNKLIRSALASLLVGCSGPVLAPVIVECDAGDHQTDTDAEPNQTDAGRRSVVDGGTDGGDGGACGASGEPCCVGGPFGLSCDSDDPNGSGGNCNPATVLCP